MAKEKMNKVVGNSFENLKEDDMKQIAECIYLTAKDFDNSKDKIREMVTAICKKYPLYE